MNGLVDWWIGGLVDWWIGGLVDWWIGGLMDWWIDGPKQTGARTSAVSLQFRPYATRDFPAICADETQLHRSWNLSPKGDLLQALTNDCPPPGGEGRGEGERLSNCNDTASVRAPARGEGKIQVGGVKQ